MRGLETGFFSTSWSKIKTSSKRRPAKPVGVSSAIPGVRTKIFGLETSPVFFVGLNATAGVQKSLFRLSCFPVYSVDVAQICQLLTRS